MDITEDRDWGATEDVFVANVRRIRMSEGISQTELAKRVTALGVTGFHQQTVAKIESGARPVRLNEATAIAEALGYWFNHLLKPSNEDSARRALARFILSYTSVWESQWQAAVEMARLADVHRDFFLDDLNYYKGLTEDPDSEFMADVERVLELLQNAAERGSAAAEAWSRLSHPATRGRLQAVASRDLGPGLGELIDSEGSDGVDHEAP